MQISLSYKHAIRRCYRKFVRCRSQISAERGVRRQINYVYASFEMNVKLRNARLFLMIVFLSLTLMACGGGDSSVDNNTAPIANGGTDQILVVSSLVSLDGRGRRDTAGDSLSYTWSFASRPVSSSATLSNSTSEFPSFVADVVGDYVLSLTVNDSDLDSNPDTVSIFIVDPNTAPIANAGTDQTLVVSSLVSLDGSGSSDTDGDSLSYTWSFASRPVSSSATLSNSTSESPSFVADVVGDYVLSLTVNDGNLDSVVDEITITVATSVGGIISSNTTWNLINSPYLITSKVQIAHGITLQIDEGVKVIGNDGDIQVFGILNAIGSINAKIKFDNVNIVPGNGPTNEWLTINIDYAEVNSGSIYYPTGNAVYGSLSLRNSILLNISYIYLIRPTEDSFFERNIFISSGGISVLDHESGSIYIRNNVFYQYTGDNGQEYAIKNNGSSGTSETIAESNSFLSTDRIALILPNAFTSADITAINNYWNTTDTSEIESMIYDKNDDLGSANYIMYSPFLIVPHPDTPDSTPYIQ